MQPQAAPVAQLDMPLACLGRLAGTPERGDGVVELLLLPVSSAQAWFQKRTTPSWSWLCTAIDGLSSIAATKRYSQSSTSRAGRPWKVDRGGSGKSLLTNNPFLE
jgi:hypothetical protein